jgi:3-methyladenine DNA glycosylase AlkD
MMKDNLDNLPLPESLELQKLVDLVTQALEGGAEDPEYKAGISMAVPGALKTFGVRVPDLRKIAKSIGRQYKAHPEGLIDLSVELWAQASREHRLIALFLLADLKQLSAEQRWELGVRFLPDISDWETCDQMCHALLGQALVEDPVYMDELESWVTDDNFWVRRAAIVSTVLLRRAKYDPSMAEALDERALAMCAQLLDDDEHYIRKAVDWTVREVIKRHEELVFRWMLDQSDGGLSSIARSTMKKAAKKLPQAKQIEWLETIEG